MTTPITSINSTQLLQDVQAYGDVADDIHRVQEDVDNIPPDTFGDDEYGHKAWENIQSVVSGSHDLLSGARDMMRGAGLNLVNVVQIFGNATDTNINNVKRLNH